MWGQRCGLLITATTAMPAAVVHDKESATTSPTTNVMFHLLWRWVGSGVACSSPPLPQCQPLLCLRDNKVTPKPHQRSSCLTCGGDVGAAVRLAHHRHYRNA
jgi:hypothetical protein